LCLVEGYLASLHDLVSFKIEHTICSRVRCITKENTIDRPSIKLIQLLPFLKDKALATKVMEVTHLGCATVHQLVTGFRLVHSKVDPVQNIACVIQRLSQNLLGVLCSSSIVRAISHKVPFSFPQHHSGEAYTDSKTDVQDPSHGKRFRNESF
jgi:hypothetical protein